jgi:serine protease Do
MPVNLTVARFGNSDDLRVGDLAVAIGTQGGTEFGPVRDRGNYQRAKSALNYKRGIAFKLIQTDAAINPEIPEGR